MPNKYGQFVNGDKITVNGWSYTFRAGMFHADSDRAPEKVIQLSDSRVGDSSTGPRQDLAIFEDDSTDWGRLSETLFNKLTAPNVLNPKPGDAYGKRERAYLGDVEKFGRGFADLNKDLPDRPEDDSYWGRLSENLFNKLTAGSDLQKRLAAIENMPVPEARLAIDALAVEGAASHIVPKMMASLQGLAERIVPKAAELSSAILEENAKSWGEALDTVGLEGWSNAATSIGIWADMLGQSVRDEELKKAEAATEERKRRLGTDLHFNFPDTTDAENILRAAAGWESSTRGGWIRDVTPSFMDQFGDKRGPLNTQLGLWYTGYRYQSALSDLEEERAAGSVSDVTRKRVLERKQEYVKAVKDNTEAKVWANGFADEYARDSSITQIWKGLKDGGDTPGEAISSTIDAVFDSAGEMTNQILQWGLLAKGTLLARGAAAAIPGVKATIFGRMAPVLYNLYKTAQMGSVQAADVLIAGNAKNEFLMAKRDYPDDAVKAEWETIGYGLSKRYKPEDIKKLLNDPKYDYKAYSTYAFWSGEGITIFEDENGKPVLDPRWMKWDHPDRFKKANDGAWIDQISNRIVSDREKAILEHTPVSEKILDPGEIFWDSAKTTALVGAYEFGGNLLNASAIFSKRAVAAAAQRYAAVATISTRAGAALSRMPASIKFFVDAGRKASRAVAIVSEPLEEGFQAEAVASGMKEVDAYDIVPAYTASGDQFGYNLSGETATSLEKGVDDFIASIFMSVPNAAGVIGDKMAAAKMVREVQREQARKRKLVTDVTKSLEVINEGKSVSDPLYRHNVDLQVKGQSNVSTPVAPMRDADEPFVPTSEQITSGQAGVEVDRRMASFAKERWKLITERLKQLDVLVDKFMNKQAIGLESARKALALIEGRDVVTVTNADIQQDITSPRSKLYDFAMNRRLGTDPNTPLPSETHPDLFIAVRKAMNEADVTSITTHADEIRQLIIFNFPDIAEQFGLYGQDSDVSAALGAKVSTPTPALVGAGTQVDVPASVYPGHADSAMSDRPSGQTTPLGDAALFGPGSGISAEAAIEALVNAGFTQLAAESLITETTTPDVIAFNLLGIRKVVNNFTLKDKSIMSDGVDANGNQVKVFTLPYLRDPVVVKVGPKDGITAILDNAMSEIVHRINSAQGYLSGGRSVIKKNPALIRQEAADDIMATFGLTVDQAYALLDNKVRAREFAAQFRAVAEAQLLSPAQPEAQPPAQPEAQPPAQPEAPAAAPPVVTKVDVLNRAGEIAATLEKRIEKYKADRAANGNSGLVGLISNHPGIRNVRSLTDADVLASLKKDADRVKEKLEEIKKKIEADAARLAPATQGGQGQATALGGFTFVGASEEELQAQAAIPNVRPQLSEEEKRGFIARSLENIERFLHGKASEERSRNLRAWALKTQLAARIYRRMDEMIAEALLGARDKLFMEDMLDTVRNDKNLLVWRVLSFAYNTVSAVQDAHSDLPIDSKDVLGRILVDGDLMDSTKITEADIEEAAIEFGKRQLGNMLRAIGTEYRPVTGAGEDMFFSSGGKLPMSRQDGIRAVYRYVAEKVDEISPAFADWVRGVANKAMEDVVNANAGEDVVGLQGIADNITSAYSNFKDKLTARFPWLGKDADSEKTKKNIDQLFIRWLKSSGASDALLGQAAGIIGASFAVREFLDSMLEESADSAKEVELRKKNKSRRNKFYAAVYRAVQANGNPAVEKSLRSLLSSIQVFGNQVLLVLRNSSPTQISYAELAKFVLEKYEKDFTQMAQKEASRIAPSMKLYKKNHMFLRYVRDLGAPDGVLRELAKILGVKQAAYSSGVSAQQAEEREFVDNLAVSMGMGELISPENVASAVANMNTVLQLIRDKQAGVGVSEPLGANNVIHVPGKVLSGIARFVGMTFKDFHNMMIRSVHEGDVTEDELPMRLARQLTGFEERMLYIKYLEDLGAPPLVTDVARMLLNLSPVVWGAIGVENILSGTDVSIQASTFGLGSAALAGEGKRTRGKADILRKHWLGGDNSESSEIADLVAAVEREYGGAAQGVISRSEEDEGIEQEVEREMDPNIRVINLKDQIAADAAQSIFGSTKQAVVGTVVGGVRVSRAILVDPSLPISDAPKEAQERLEVESEIELLRAEQELDSAGNEERLRKYYMLIGVGVDERTGQDSFVLLGHVFEASFLFKAAGDNESSYRRSTPNRFSPEEREIPTMEEQPSTGFSKATRFFAMPTEASLMAVLDRTRTLGDEDPRREISKEEDANPGAGIALLRSAWRKSASPHGYRFASSAFRDLTDRLFDQLGWNLPHTAAAAVNATPTSVSVDGEVELEGFGLADKNGVWSFGRVGPFEFSGVRGRDYDSDSGAGKDGEIIGVLYYNGIPVGDIRRRTKEKPSRWGGGKTYKQKGYEATLYPRFDGKQRSVKTTHSWHKYLRVVRRDLVRGVKRLYPHIVAREKDILNQMNLPDLVFNAQTNWTGYEYEQIAGDALLAIKGLSKATAAALKAGDWKLYSVVRWYYPKYFIPNLDEAKSDTDETAENKTIIAGLIYASPDGTVVAIPVEYEPGFGYREIHSAGDTAADWVSKKSYESMEGGSEKISSNSFKQQFAAILGGTRKAFLAKRTQWKEGYVISSPDHPDVLMRVIGVSYITANDLKNKSDVQLMLSGAGINSAELGFDPQNPKDTRAIVYVRPIRQAPDVTKSSLPGSTGTEQGGVGGLAIDVTERSAPYRPSNRVVNDPAVQRAVVIPTPPPNVGDSIMGSEERQMAVPAPTDVTVASFVPAARADGKPVPTAVLFKESIFEGARQIARVSLRRVEGRRLAGMPKIPLSLSYYESNNLIAVSTIREKKKRDARPSVRDRIDNFIHRVQMYLSGDDTLSFGSYSHIGKVALPFAHVFREKGAGGTEVLHYTIRYPRTGELIELFRAKREELPGNLLKYKIAYRGSSGKMVYETSTIKLNLKSPDAALLEKRFLTSTRDRVLAAQGKRRLVGSEYYATIKHFVSDKVDTADVHSEKYGDGRLVHGYVWEVDPATGELRLIGQLATVYFFSTERKAVSITKFAQKPESFADVNYIIKNIDGFMDSKGVRTRWTTIPDGPVNGKTEEGKAKGHQAAALFFDETLDTADIEAGTFSQSEERRSRQIYIGTQDRAATLDPVLRSAAWRKLASNFSSRVYEIISGAKDDNAKRLAKAIGMIVNSKGRGLNKFQVRSIVNALAANDIFVPTETLTGRETSPVSVERFEDSRKSREPEFSEHGSAQRMIENLYEMLSKSASPFAFYIGLRESGETHDRASRVVGIIESIVNTYVDTTTDKKGTPKFTKADVYKMMGTVLYPGGPLPGGVKGAFIGGMKTPWDGTNVIMVSGDGDPTDTTLHEVMHALDFGGVLSRLLGASSDLEKAAEKLVRSAFAKALTAYGIEKTKEIEDAIKSESKKLATALPKNLTVNASLTKAIGNILDRSLRSKLPSGADTSRHAAEAIAEEYTRLFTITDKEFRDIRATQYSFINMVASAALAVVASAASTHKVFGDVVYHSIEGIKEFANLVKNPASVIHGLFSDELLVKILSQDTTPEIARALDGLYSARDGVQMSSTARQNALRHLAYSMASPYSGELAGILKGVVDPLMVVPGVANIMTKARKRAADSGVQVAPGSLADILKKNGMLPTVILLANLSEWRGDDALKVLAADPNDAGGLAIAKKLLNRIDWFIDERIELLEVNDPKAAMALKEAAAAVSLIVPPKGGKAPAMFSDMVDLVVPVKEGAGQIQKRRSGWESDEELRLTLSLEKRLAFGKAVFFSGATPEKYLDMVELAKSQGEFPELPISDYLNQGSFIGNKGPAVREPVVAPQNLIRPSRPEPSPLMKFPDQIIRMFEFATAAAASSGYRVNRLLKIAERGLRGTNAKKFAAEAFAYFTLMQGGLSRYMKGAIEGSIMKVVVDYKTLSVKLDRAGDGILSIIRRIQGPQEYDDLTNLLVADQEIAIQRINRWKILRYKKQVDPKDEKTWQEVLRTTEFRIWARDHLTITDSRAVNNAYLTKALIQLKYGVDYGSLKEHVDAVHDYQRYSVFEQLVSAGLLTPEEEDILKAVGTTYMPFKQVMSSRTLVEQYNRSLEDFGRTAGSQLHHREGDLGKGIENPWMSMVFDASFYGQFAHKQIARNLFHHTYKLVQEQGSDRAKRLWSHHMKEAWVDVAKAKGLPAMASPDTGTIIGGTRTDKVIPTSQLDDPVKWYNSLPATDQFQYLVAYENGNPHFYHMSADLDRSIMWLDPEIAALVSRGLWKVSEQYKNWQGTLEEKDIASGDGNFIFNAIKRWDQRNRKAQARFKIAEWQRYNEAYGATVQGEDSPIKGPREPISLGREVMNLNRSIIGMRSRLAISNLRFAMRQLTKDSFSTALYNNNGFIPLFDTAIGMFMALPELVPALGMTPWGRKRFKTWHTYATSLGYQNKYAAYLPAHIETQFRPNPEGASTLSDVFEIELGGRTVESKPTFWAALEQSIITTMHDVKRKQLNGYNNLEIAMDAYWHGMEHLANWTDAANRLGAQRLSQLGFSGYWDRFFKAIRVKKLERAWGPGTDVDLGKGGIPPSYYVAAIDANIDFRSGGMEKEALSSMYMFFNPKAQELRRFVNTFFNGGEHTLAAWTRGLVWGGVAALLMVKALDDDDWAEKSPEEIMGKIPIFKTRSGFLSLYLPPGIMTSVFIHGPAALLFEIKTRLWEEKVRQQGEIKLTSDWMYDPVSAEIPLAGEYTGGDIGAGEYTDAPGVRSHQKAMTDYFVQGIEPFGIVGAAKAGFEREGVPGAALGATVALLPGSVTPFLELSTNTNSFGRTIDSSAEYDTSTLPHLRTSPGDNITEQVVANIMAKPGLRMSPSQWGHLIESYFPYYGRIASEAVSHSVEPGSGVEKAVQAVKQGNVEGTPIEQATGFFTGRSSGRSSRSYQDYMRLKEAANRFEGMLKKPSNASEVESLMEENWELLVAKVLIGQTDDVIKDIDAKLDSVYSSNKSDWEKAVEINALKEMLVTATYRTNSLFAEYVTLGRMDRNNVAKILMLVPGEKEDDLRAIIQKFVAHGGK